MKWRFWNWRTEKALAKKLREEEERKKWLEAYEKNEQFSYKNRKLMTDLFIAVIRKRCEQLEIRRIKWRQRYINNNRVRVRFD